MKLSMYNYKQTCSKTKIRTSRHEVKYVKLQVDMQ